MKSKQNETNIVLKRIKPRYICIDENIHEALDLYTLSLYLAFRYEADYEKEDSEIRRSAQFLANKAKISRRQFFLSLNILEDFGLVLRDPKSPLNSISIYHVAQELHYFNTICRGVQDVHTGVHGVHTDHYSLSNNIINNIINSESIDSSTPVIKEKIKSKPEGLLKELIDIYRQEFPDNPQPHKTLISTSLRKVLQSLIKQWPEADTQKRPLTPQAFRNYLIALRESAPKFSLGEYMTPNGTRRKNGLETFARWNTLVKFLENQYS